MTGGRAKGGKWPSERLEPYAGKLARTVLKGAWGPQGPWAYLVANSSPTAGALVSRAELAYARQPVGQLDQFAKDTFAEETPVLTQGAVIWQLPPEIGTTAQPSLSAP